MKKMLAFICAAVLTAGMSFSVQAQDIDYSSLEGSNYYVIWLDAETEAEWEITDKIVQDLRPNWSGETNPDGERAIYIWENQWGGAPANGLGSFGQVEGYIAFTKLLGWAGLGFCMRDNAPASVDVDYTAITDDYRFHMAVKTASPISFGIELVGQTGGAAKFSAGAGGVAAAGFEPNITPNFVSDGNTWNVLDIPVSDLRAYGFMNRGTFRGNFFNIISPDQGTGWTIGIDAVFFYNPEPAGIVNPDADTKLKVLVTNQIVEVLNATAPIEVYNIAGVKVKVSEKPVFGVDELNKGAYILKSGKAVTKVIIK